MPPRAMSQENVEVVRQAWEAFRRRDTEAALALYDAEVELHSAVDGRVYRGLDGVRDFFRDWLAVWDDFSADVEEWVNAETMWSQSSAGRAVGSTAPSG